MLILNYCHFACWKTALWSKFVWVRSTAVLLWDPGHQPLSPSTLYYLVPSSLSKSNIYANISQSTWLHWRCFVKNCSVLNEFGKHYTFYYSVRGHTLTPGPLDLSPLPDILFIWISRWLTPLTNANIWENIIYWVKYTLTTLF